MLRTVLVRTQMYGSCSHAGLPTSMRMCKCGYFVRGPTLHLLQTEAKLLGLPARASNAQVAASGSQRWRTRGWDMSSAPHHRDGTDQNFDFKHADIIMSRTEADLASAPLCQGVCLERTGKVMTLKRLPCLPSELLKLPLQGQGHTTSSRIRRIFGRASPCAFEGV